MEIKAWHSLMQSRWISQTLHFCPSIFFSSASHFQSLSFVFPATRCCHGVHSFSITWVRWTSYFGTWNQNHRIHVMDMGKGVCRNDTTWRGCCCGNHPKDPWRPRCFFASFCIIMIYSIIERSLLLWWNDVPCTTVLLRPILHRWHCLKILIVGPHCHIWLWPCVEP